MEDGLSFRSVAKKLGVDTNTIIKYARLDPENESVSHEVVLLYSQTAKTKISSKKRKVVPVRVDWEKRDLELSWEVEEVCIKLLDNKQEKPTRITISSVGKRVGKLSLLEKHKGKLPVTMAVLSNHLETVEQYQLRRIQWAAEQMQNEFPIKRWQLIRKAGIRPGYSRAVSAALDHYSGYGMHTFNSAGEVMIQWLQ
ncbi:hypothetical protein D3C81_1487710 [compost metagenome]